MRQARLPFRLSALLLACAATVMAAVCPSPLRAAREINPLTANEVVKKVGVDQRLGDTVPLDLPFRDETGAEVKLGDYFKSKRPVVLSLVYYECPSLCTMTLNGMATAFKPLAFTPGKEFEVVTVSFNPAEKPALAAQKKAAYLKSYGRPGAEKGWHFLTGDADSIKALTEATGFRYIYDERAKQYAHASVIMILTPQGKLARYYYGLEYSSRDLRLGMIEASDEKIGTLADAVTLLCYQYDMSTGKYSWAVMTTVRLAGLVMVLGLSSYVGLMLMRERRRAAMTGQQALVAGRDRVAADGVKTVEPRS